MHRVVKIEQQLRESRLAQAYRCSPHIGLTDGLFCHERTGHNTKSLIEF
jgi:hypothetical protein